MVTNSQLIVRAGQALYGDQWQVPLSRDLGLNERTVRRIAQAEREGAEYQIAPGAMLDLIAIVRDRKSNLHGLEHQLATAAGLPPA